MRSTLGVLKCLLAHAYTIYVSFDHDKSTQTGLKGLLVV